MNWLHKEHTFKSIVSFLIVAVVVITAVHVVLYISVKNIVEEQIGRGAQTLAVSVADHIMSDIDDYKEFMATPDINSEYYTRMQRYFANIKSGSNIKFIYTEREIDQDTIEFILDAEEIGSEDYSPPGMLGANDDMRRSVYTGRKPAGFGVYSYPKWGDLIVAYAPIFDAGGDFLGLAGANIDGNELTVLLTRLNLTMVGIYILVLAGIIFIFVKSSSFIFERLMLDRLTGAISRRYLDKIIKEEMIRAVRDKTNLTLCMLDLDHFKNINDEYGHIFGDQTLAAVSATIKKFLRQSDYFVRYGGEEFVVILPKISLENAGTIAERIRAAVAATEIVNAERRATVHVTISIGVADLSTNLDAEKLLLNADQALYLAKNNRNTVTVFEG